jgi:hypothetical protein
MIDFINGDYPKAIASWRKIVGQDSGIILELQPWIEKAQVKLQGKEQ